MGRLIDVSNIRVKPQYMQDVMGIAMIRCEDLSRILADVPRVEAIPKADYETRLKADMIAMLEEIESMFWELTKNKYDMQILYEKADDFEIDFNSFIQRKIDKLKGE